MRSTPMPESPGSSTPAQNEPTSLEELLDRLQEAEVEEGEVALGAIFDRIGHRSFGPLLLVAGLVTVAPIIGDIPGVPTLMAVLVVLTAAQLLLRRDHVWLPRWLLRRRIGKDKLDKSVDAIRKPVAFVDRGIRARLTGLVGGAGAYVIAGACILIALAMPPMELIPFSANLAGAALTAFGLALTADDGVLALVAYAFTGGVIWVVVTTI